MAIVQDSNVDMGGGGSYLDLSGLTGINAFFYRLRKRIQDTLSAAWANVRRVSREVADLAESLLAGAEGADNLTSSIKKTASVTVKATKRVLTDFDEIRRLSTKTGGSYSISGLSINTGEAERLASVMQVLIDRIKEAMSAMEIACAGGIARLFAAVESGFQMLMSVEKMVGSLLNCILDNFIASWGSIWSVLSGTATRLNENVIQPVLSGVSTMLVKLWTLFDGFRQGVAALFTGIAVLAARGWDAVAGVWAGAHAWFVRNVIQPLRDLFSGLWTSIGNLAGIGLVRTQEMLAKLAVWIGTNMIRRFAELFSQFWGNIVIGAMWTAVAIKAVLTAAIQTLGNVFRETWANVMKAFTVNGSVFVDIQKGTASVFKTLINDLIRGLNSVLQTSFGGLNKALLTLKNTEIQGQKPFSGLRTVTVPQIPYLAQGAVLPANRPFLAVVGDQKNGTNVEAPLSTIQEALMLAMEELGAGTDQSEILEVLRQILQAVSGIRIGDEVIGQAAARYNRKMAVVRGGSL